MYPGLPVLESLKMLLKWWATYKVISDKVKGIPVVIHFLLSDSKRSDINGVEHALHNKSIATDVLLAVFCSYNFDQASIIHPMHH